MFEFTRERGRVAKISVKETWAFIVPWIPRVAPETDDEALLQSEFIKMLVADAVYREAAIALLNTLSQSEFMSAGANKLPEIALELAKARLNATVGAPLTECQEQVAELLVLYTHADSASWSTLPEIALELAQARVNATVGAGLTSVTIKWLNCWFCIPAQTLLLGRHFLKSRCALAKARYNVNVVAGLTERQEQVAGLLDLYTRADWSWSTP